VLAEGVELVRQGKRRQERMYEWFFVQELLVKHRQELAAQGRDLATPATRAELLCRLVRDMPISIPAGTAIAGTQDGAFSASYALINPSFKVETFAGYCDPTAIYKDVELDPAQGIDQQRTDRVRAYWESTEYVRELQQVYQGTGDEAREVVYFMEPVTGHTIPDLRPSLRHGVRYVQQQALGLGTEYGKAMAAALEAATTLGQRYQRLAQTMAEKVTDPSERRRLQAIATALARVPAGPAVTLHEAVQSFALLWQVMALEQAPNPYAFSVGNLDRLLQPYFDPARESRDEAVALVRHLLTLFQVGKRCWAISQNVLVAGCDAGGKDLTCDMTYVVLDAFFQSNDPQPALSVKVHGNTPAALYQSLGRFFFTHGHSTPSLFNDDSLFPMLQRHGVAEADVADYAIAGCQEPLVMGKSSLNTTNTWLNLAKVLELACNDGLSLISNKRLGPSWTELGVSGGEAEAYGRLEELFYQTLDWFLPRMARAGNACTSLLGKHLPVPFTSVLMDSLHTGRDMRDPALPGTRYHGSGCLVHGLSVVANSLCAMKRALDSRIFAPVEIRRALQSDFRDAQGLQRFLLSQEAFGNDSAEVDAIAARLVTQVGQRIRALRNGAGSAFLPDWSTPSTHLLYGYLTGATPDGRPARQMLGYGVDARVGTTQSGLAGQMLSAWKLPFHEMNGGYASHIGLRPPVVGRQRSLEQQGEWMRDEVIRPLFRLGEGHTEAPYYVYFNIDDATHLREVLANPRKHAPTGVYIMRIHGTFVNFLDLSPAIQEDIIRRLEPAEARP
jgi:formate C-acetyltransferase